MALVAAIAAGMWGAANAGIANRTQWQYLQAQGREIRIQAQQIRSIGASEIRMFQRQSQYRVGAIQASWGHSGVAADSGSAFESIMAQAAVHGLTKLQIQRNVDIQARNMDVSAAFADYQREILDQQLPLQLINGALQGVASGLSHGSTTSSFGLNFLEQRPTVGQPSYGSSAIGTAIGT